MKSLEKLLSVATAGLGPKVVMPNVPVLMPFASLGNELKHLLSLRNGFYAFESALHVFPAESGAEMNLNDWNLPGLWRFEYGDLADSTLFFAEDAFGNQFSLRDGRVCFFDAETGEQTAFAADLEGWAERILKHCNVSTGYPLLHDWQQKNSALANGTRLMPKLPFVLGGRYSVDNLYCIAGVSGMKTRGDLARQLKDLPDGTQVRFEIVD